MLVQGSYKKIGNQWIAEIPMLYTVLSTKPGEDKNTLISNIKNLADQSEIDISFVAGEQPENFFFEVKNIDKFLPIILKRTRLAKKLSIRDVTTKLGYTSRNSYAQYEYGKTKLTFSKYLEFLEAMDPNTKVVLTKIQ